jgi:tRNA dimethylallyltransferase
MKAIIVVGATATGKSRLALEIVKKTNGVIINSDSIQFYQPLRIGSAAPSDIDLKMAPHYLYSYVNAPTEMTAGQFCRDFHTLINDEDFIFDHKDRPLVIVGGTGFYIQALEKGMFNVPQVDPLLKQQIEEEINTDGNEKAYQELISFDPDTKIHLNDAYRIGRALEIKRSFNLKMSDLHKESLMDTKLKIPFPYIKFGVDIDKSDLINIIQTRTSNMLKDGLIDETQSLIDLGFSDWAPMNSVGYSEVKAFLNQKIKRSELEPLINLSTLQLTKKQKTWFKRDPDINWIDPTSDAQIGSAIEKVRSFLKT